MESIVAGFNTVTSHMSLLLFPVLLDVFLWLGPRLRINDLYNIRMPATFKEMAALMPAETLPQVLAAEKFLQANVPHVNLVSSLSTLPVGIPSLVASLGPVKSLLGTALSLEVTSSNAAIGLSLLFSLVGLLLGALYFNRVARLTENEAEPFSLRVFGRQAWQTVLLLLLLILAILLVSVPTFTLLMIMLAISPGGVQLIWMMLLFALIWVALPLVFTPHGIFANRQTSINAALTSVRLVRRYLPGTGLFLLIALLLTQGLDLLWSAPPEDSWLLILGIGGHAFIYTAILASSFIYYRGGIRYMLFMQKNPGQPVDIRPLL